MVYRTSLPGTVGLSNQAATIGVLRSRLSPQLAMLTHDLMGDYSCPTSHLHYGALPRLEGREGLEPPTFGFGDRRSTN